MSMQAHVRTKSIVEYSDENFFESRMFEIIGDIIKYYCEYALLEDETGYFKDNWEIDIDSYKSMLDTINDIGVYDFIPEDSNFKSSEIVEALNNIYKQATKKDNQFSYPEYIYIDWF